jgi:putative ATP-dependent endonuclease of OLD family
MGEPMKISNMTIKNFKSFDDEGASFSVSDITTFVGANNSGKSNVIKALDIFFNYLKSKIDKDCFHNGNLSVPIEIVITFTNLKDEETKIFRPHLNPDSSLTIVQRIELVAEGQITADTEFDDVEVNEDKYGILLKPTQDWLSLEKSPTKSKIQSWWQTDLITEDGVSFKEYCCNPEEAPSVEEYEQKLAEFWVENINSISTEEVQGDSKVLGWKNKLKGNLPNFIYVPGVQTIEDMVKVQKTNPFGLILRWIMGDIQQERAADVQEQLEVLVEQAFTHPEGELGEESRRKDEFLRVFNEFLSDQFDLRVDLEFEPPKIGDLLLGGVQIYGDDGYRSLLNEKGHGVQRSAIFTLLRTYAHLRDELVDSPSRNTIFGIEEPEIYLHPPVRRATYQLLRKIAEGEDQVLYSTHDGYFVDVEYFDEIRLLRREAKDGAYRTTVIQLPIDHLVKDCMNRYGRDVDPGSIRQSFRRFYDPATNEGFFSKKVLIAEGETEKAALPIYLHGLGYDINLNEVSILHAGGKGIIDFLYIIFNEFGIPTYVVLDGDSPIGEVDLDALPKEKRKGLAEKAELNRTLLELLGQSEIAPEGEFGFPSTRVAENVAIWRNDFETQIHHPLERYEQWKSEAKAFFGSDSKQLIARYIAQQVVEDEDTEIPELVRTLLQRIDELVWRGSCLMLEVQGAEA